MVVVVVDLRTNRVGQFTSDAVTYLLRLPLTADEFESKAAAGVRGITPLAIAYLPTRVVTDSGSHRTRVVRIIASASADEVG
jgi:hypothetical protein